MSIGTKYGNGTIVRHSYYYSICFFVVCVPTAYYMLLLLMLLLILAIDVGCGTDLSKDVDRARDKMMTRQCSNVVVYGRFLLASSIS